MTNLSTVRVEKAKATIVGVLIVILIILMAWLADAPERELLAKVQSGESVLICLFKDGWRDVEPAKVKDLHGNVWIFVNGSASRCEVL